MIVRILSEGQYRLDDTTVRTLDEIDNRLLEAVSRGDEGEFRDALDEVLSVVRRGEKLPDDFLGASDLILPEPDATLAEAQRLLANYPEDLDERAPQEQ